MHVRKFLALGLLALSLPAAAELRTITEVYEVDMPDLRLPSIEGGTVSFKTCSECEFRTLRVRSGARFVLNGKDVTLKKFTMAVSNVANREDLIIDVFHHLESNTVTALMVRV
ncbi:MAG: hypothetical protein KJO31_13515 [Gammaproteobacteria bacterium]|nr:hypothetical protein [Gammaproteobacteria bacterium]